MINASAEFLDQCQNNGKRWHRILESEREIRQQLEDMVQQLAKQHSHLEAMVKKEYQDHHNTSTIHTNSVLQGSEESNKEEKKDPVHRIDSVLGQQSTSTSFAARRSVSSTYSGTGSDDDDFEDALDTPAICFNVPVPPSRRRTSSEESFGAKSALGDDGSLSDDEVTKVCITQFSAFHIL